METLVDIVVKVDAGQAIEAVRVGVGVLLNERLQLLEHRVHDARGDREFEFVSAEIVRKHSGTLLAVVILKNTAGKVNRKIGIQRFSLQVTNCESGVQPAPAAW
jgi:hypothetical protein